MEICTLVLPSLSQLTRKTIVTLFVGGNVDKKKTTNLNLWKENKTDLQICCKLKIRMAVLMN